ncbi:MAG: IS91 family transposase [Chloroflexota bacterium]
MGSPSIQDILREYYPEYERQYPVADAVREAVHAMLSCRTAVLGGHKQQCPDGHYTRIWYNSCKHRACPQCAYLKTAQWLEAQKARLLNCEHYHGIFTIPHDFNALWLCNTAVMANLLFNSAKHSLLDLLDDPKYLGARPGIIMALHTWGQSLILHPHIHCLITGGGLEGQQWKATKNGFLVPVVLLMERFRERLIKALRLGLKKGTLSIPEGETLESLEASFCKAEKTKWNVHIRERYEHGEGVAHYLAKYLHGGPVGNSRLLCAEAGKVTFKYFNNHDKDESGQGKADTMTLTATQFLQRLFLHVPPPRMHTVRAYGLYANARAERLNYCRGLPGQAAVEKPHKRDWQDHYTDNDEQHPECCPVCNKRLVRGAIILPQKKHVRPTALHKSGVPPPPKRQYRQAA